jgi:hypothetical protein
LPSSRFPRDTSHEFAINVTDSVTRAVADAFLLSGLPYGVALLELDHSAEIRWRNLYGIPQSTAVGAPPGALSNTTSA